MTHPFDRCIDAAAMGEIFQARLWPLAEGGPKVLGCDILFAHHRAYLGRESQHKSYLTLCFGLRLADDAYDNRARSGASMFCAKAYLDDRSAEETAAASPDCYWPELRMALWRFPHDPQLLHLPKVIDPAAVRDYLPYDKLPTGYEASAAVSRICAEVIHYYPEERCICRYDLESSAPRGSRSLSLFGKTFNDDRGEKVYRHQLELWRITQRKTRKFIVARPLGYSAKVMTLWLEHISGVPAIRFLSGAACQAWLSATADGLADLHRLTPFGAAQHRSDDQLRDLRSKSKKLAHGFPGLASLLRSLQRDLVLSSASLASTRECFIHGDFHLRQLLVRGDEVVFLDFDECGVGDPLQDVASFLVDLYFYEFGADEAARMGWQFLQAYQRATGWKIPLDRLDWQVRLQFFTKAYRVYRQHQSDREQKIGWLLGLAERGIGDEAGARNVASSAGERTASL